MTRVAIGIDIGGTSCKFAVVTREGEILGRGAVPTDRADARTTLAALVAAIRSRLGAAREPVDPIGVGVGAPNANPRRGTIEHAPNLDWGPLVPIGEWLGREFGLPVRVANDANAAAWGERLYGAARGLDEFVLVTLGTGVGSGFVTHGQLLEGADGFAGELGHTVVRPGGRRCGCGGRGCLEAYASVTGLVRTARELMESAAEPSVLARVPPQRLTGPAVWEAAQEGDAVARAAFDATGEILGLGLANAVAITGPSAVILAGGLARAGELILAPARRGLGAHLFPVFRGRVRLMSSGLDEDAAGVLGAAALAWGD